MAQLPFSATLSLLATLRSRGFPSLSISQSTLSCTGMSICLPPNLPPALMCFRYYFQSARGVRIWWKKYITMLQIIQFVIDLGFVYFASYTYFTSTYFPWMPNAGNCAGEEFAAFAGMAILSSYLVLFISFYFATYRNQVKTGRPRRNTGREALIAMKDFPADANKIVPVFDDEKKANGAVSTGRANGPSTRSRKA